MSDSSILRGIYLFKELTDDQVSIIGDVVEKLALAAGDKVFSQGDDAHALYMIKYGSIKIEQRGEKGESIQIATLGTGSHFGEMAFLDSERRSASAIATERTELLRIKYDRLRQLLAENSDIAVNFYHALSRFLCGRLRITTEDLNFARELNLRHF